MRRRHKPTLVERRRNRPTKKMEAISIRLDEQVRAALDEIVEEEGRSLSGHINWVLKRHVKQWRRKQQQEPC
jgi:hypothetical protein